jgi:spermidine synthase
VAFLVALSGLCSLVYQVVWERTLRYSFGGDSVSAAVVTGTFLLGLGIGAAVFGRWRPRPFATYARVEAAIGLYGLASFHLLAPLALVLGRLFPAPPSVAGGLRPIVLAAAVVFLLPPCVLIGGTGPLAYNCFVRPGVYAARAVGLIYAMNTAGAALGVLGAPFLLLNRFSLPVTLALVGAANLCLAALLARLGRRAGEDIAPEPPEHAPAPSREPGRAPGLLVLGATSGLIGLAFEVCLIRALFVQNPSSPYNFPAALGPYLLALAAGSALFTRFRSEAPPRVLRRIGLLLAGGAVSMLLGLVLSAALTAAHGRAADLPRGPGALALLAHALLLGIPLPLFLGGVLPLLLRLLAPTGAALPRESGWLYLANAGGAFAGATLTQFLGFPFLGSHGVLAVLYLAGLAAGGVCLWRAGAPSPAGRRGALAVLCALATVPFLLPAPLWRILTAGSARDTAEVVEGVTGIAHIDWQPDGGEVIVNGQLMSRLPDHPRHVRLVAFALALPRRADVLLLGLGGGGMVRELARDPAIRRLEVVDWSHELPQLLERPRARALLDNALQRPHVTLRSADARVAVGLHPAGSFDVVVDNLTIAHWVGATSVKSIQYFRQLRRILRGDGVLVYHGNWGGARRSILAGLTQTFHHVYTHRGAGPVEEVILASDVPVHIDPGHLHAVLRRLAASTRMAPGGDLLAGLVAVTRSDVGRARPVRDELLVHEYHRDPIRAVKRFLRSLGRPGDSVRARSPGG